MKTNKILLSEAVVYVVDDDPSICSGLSSLLRSEGVQVFTFGSPEGFLNIEMADVPSCLILDIRLRGANGLTLQQEALREGIRLPIIFLTAHGDIPMSVKAMKAGAFDFLTKPFHDQDMLDTVSAALTMDHELRIQERMVADIQGKYDALTPREKEVVVFVAEGLMNKQIAGRMGVSEETVKIHRSQAMRKMEARSVPDLVRKLQRVVLRNHRPPKSP
ncbi:MULTISPECIES: response regulator transcription factor [Paraburkholderia]|jgi:FixJ family two-component response regulator|uniref:Two component transcriptional regulator, LuxR family n=1 Tax=Paraburkholderia phenazinium TaxID=60549 RepID=A0A1N6KCI0_9BURK|nr:response regulator [Paraburkholderia phenazinium]SIO54272.1 two component transcriptional regulator, LuxR family [Paraburkholderia phenazinium]